MAQQAVLLKDDLLDPVDQLLDDPALVEMVRQCLAKRSPLSTRTGRDGIAPDRVLRCCIMKYRRGQKLDDGRRSFRIDVGGRRNVSLRTLRSNTANVAAGQKVTVTVTTSVTGGYAKAVTLSATGLPSGVTAVFSLALIASPGAGQSALTLTATTATVASTYTVNVVATSGGRSRITSLTLTLQPAPGFTLALPSTLSLSAGSGSSAQMVVSLVGSFNAPVALRVSGKPAGMTATFFACIAGRSRFRRKQPECDHHRGDCLKHLHADGDGHTAFQGAAEQRRSPPH